MTAFSPLTRTSDPNQADITDVDSPRLLSGSGSSPLMMQTRQGSQGLEQDNFSEMKLLKEIVQVTPVIPAIVITPVQILEDILRDQLRVRAKITRATQTDWNWRVMAERWRHARLITARTKPMELAELKHHLYELNLQTIIRGKEDYLSEEMEGMEKTEEWLKRSWKEKARAKLEMLREVRPCDKITDTNDLEFNPGDSPMTRNQVKLTGKRIYSRMDIKHDHPRRKTRHSSAYAKSYHAGRMSVYPGSQSVVAHLQEVDESSRDRASLATENIFMPISRRDSPEPSQMVISSSLGGSRRASLLNRASFQEDQDTAKSESSGKSAEMNPDSSHKNKQKKAKKAGNKLGVGLDNKRASLSKQGSDMKHMAASKRGSESRRGSATVTAKLGPESRRGSDTVTAKMGPGSRRGSDTVTAKMGPGSRRGSDTKLGPESKQGSESAKTSERPSGQSF